MIEDLSVSAKSSGTRFVTWVYGTQFVVIANLRFHGAALILLALLYAADVIVAWSDVLEETSSRRGQGGLPGGEYFMHVVLSLLIGCYFILVWQAAWPDRLIATAIVVDPPNVPFALRVYMSLICCLSRLHVGSLLFSADSA